MTPRRGGPLHLRLLKPFTEIGEHKGATVHEEYRVCYDGLTRYIDRVFEYRHLLVALEGETSIHRVQNAPPKAEAAGATHLFIVLPNGRLARAAERKLARVQPVFRGQLFVSPLGRALHLFGQLLKSCDVSITRGHNRNNKPRMTRIAELPSAPPQTLTACQMRAGRGKRHKSGRRSDLRGGLSRNVGRRSS